MRSKTPTEARKDFYQLLKYVNNNHEPVQIEGKYDESNAVIVGLEDWNRMLDKLHTESQGTLNSTNICSITNLEEDREYIYYKRVLKDSLAKLNTNIDDLIINNLYDENRMLYILAKVINHYTLFKGILERKNININNVLNKEIISDFESFILLDFETYILYNDPLEKSDETWLSNVIKPSIQDVIKHI